MRALFALAGLAAFAFASTAFAAPVTLAPLVLSPEFQTKLDDELGARERQELEDMVVRLVSRELTRHGADVGPGASTIVEVTLIDADPNRPTFEELTRTPGLSMSLSISTGGAELSATLRRADGQVLSEVNHQYYTRSLNDLIGAPNTWSDAHRAISRFARKVGDAYSASAN
jgi:hypothetical protein